MPFLIPVMDRISEFIDDFDTDDYIEEGECGKRIVADFGYLSLENVTGKDSSKLTGSAVIKSGGGKYLLYIKTAAAEYVICDTVFSSFTACLNKIEQLYKYKDAEVYEEELVRGGEDVIEGAYFEVFDVTGGYFFVLCDNKKNVFTSRVYKTKADCKIAVMAVKKINGKYSVI